MPDGRGCGRGAAGARGDVGRARAQRRQHAGRVGPRLHARGARHVPRDRGRDGHGHGRPPLRGRRDRAGRLRLHPEAVQAERADHQRRQRPPPARARDREPRSPGAARADRARPDLGAPRHDRAAGDLRRRAAAPARGDDSPPLVRSGVPQPGDGRAHPPHEPLLLAAGAAGVDRRRPGRDDPDREPDARRRQAGHPRQHPAQARTAHRRGAQGDGRSCGDGLPHPRRLGRRAARPGCADGAHPPRAHRRSRATRAASSATTSRSKVASRRSPTSSTRSPPTASTAPRSSPRRRER